MNKLLSEKKDIEIMIDTINQQDQRFRLITGYNEMDDSLALNTQYPPLVGASVRLCYSPIINSINSYSFNQV